MYFLFRSFFRILYRLFFRFQVIGHEHIPTTGPIVIIANHTSNWDPITLGNSVERQIHYMAKDILFRIWIIGPLVKSWGAIPVKRGAGDRQAIRLAIDILEQGRIFGIFPEGHRSKDGQLGPFFPGAASIALKGKATIIPVAIKSTYRIFQPIVVRIGAPISVDEWLQSSKKTTQVMDEMTQLMKKQVQELLDSDS